MEKLLAFFAALFIVFLVCVVLAIPTYYLWNWLMPTLFGLGCVTFWQALGLNMLSSILFHGTSTASKPNAK